MPPLQPGIACTSKQTIGGRLTPATALYKATSANAPPPPPPCTHLHNKHVGRHLAPPIALDYMWVVPHPAHQTQLLYHITHHRLARCCCRRRRAATETIRAAAAVVSRIEHFDCHRQLLAQDGSMHLQKEGCWWLMMGRAGGVAETTSAPPL